MSLLRSVRLFATGTALSIATVWLVAHHRRPQLRPDALLPGRPYAVQVDLERAELQLPFRRGTRYLLIVGSLGRRLSPDQIELHAEPIDSADFVAAEPLKPLKKDGRAARFLPVVPDFQTPKQAEASPAREFFLHVTDGPLENPDSYARVEAKLVGEGRHVRVFLDQRYSRADLASGLIDEIVFQFDQKLVPSFAQRLGKYCDVDGDGKFAVLLSPWLNRLQGGKTTLGGFVRASDFQCDRSAPFSNRCDMMYLNTGLQPGPHLETLLAHEYTHAVCFSQRLPSPGREGGLPDEEDWLTEAVAHVSENIEGAGWSNLDYRISRFLNSPERYPLVVDDYYAAGLWRNHGCRGATYLFLRWCVDQFGTGMLRRLVQAPGCGADNLQWATGHSFPDLFRRWSVALYRSGLTVPATSGPKRKADIEGIRGEHNMARHGASGDAFTSLDLRAPLENWGLAGPRLHTWNVGERQKSVNIAGTSVAFLELKADDPGAFRIRVEAGFGTGLQITLLRLPNNWPTISAEAYVADPSHVPGGAKKDDRSALIVDVAGRRGEGLQVETIACENHAGPTRESFCFTGEQLAAVRRKTDRSQFRARFELPGVLPPHEAGRWIVKVIAHDEKGRRTAAHARIDATPSPASVRMARRHTPERSRQ